MYVDWIAVPVLTHNVEHKLKSTTRLLLVDDYFCFFFDVSIHQGKTLTNRHGRLCFFRNDDAATYRIIFAPSLPSTKRVTLSKSFQSSPPTRRNTVHDPILLFFFLLVVMLKRNQKTVSVAM